MLEDYLREIRPAAALEIALRDSSTILESMRPLRVFMPMLFRGSPIGEILESAGSECVGLKRADYLYPK